MLFWLVLILLFCNTSGQGLAKPTLVLADAGWDSVRIHNGIAAYIIEQGFGYPTEVIMGSSPIVIKGLRQGDIDIDLEVWTDTTPEVYFEGIDKGEIFELGVNFDDNAQGLYVPTYVIEGDPERDIEPLAPGLESIKDLPDYWHVFQDPDNPNQGRIYGSPPSWVADEVLRTKMKTYQLDNTYDYFNPGSDTALNTSLVSAYERGEPWVGYNWDPTWITGKYDLTLLADEPYDQEKWDAGYGCEFASTRVTVAVHASMLEKAPEVVEFLRHYQTNTKITSELLAYMMDHDADLDKTVAWFFQEYEELWTGWVSSDIVNTIKASFSQEAQGFGLTSFPSALRFSIGIYVDKFISWLTANFQKFFDWLSTGVSGIVNGIKNILTWIPWFILIILVFALGWLIDHWKAGLLYGLLIFFIGMLGLWDEMLFSLSIVLTGVIFSVVLGVPLGIYMAHSKRMEGIMKPLLDGAQTMPSFVYLIPAMIFFGLGTVPAVFATIIYSMPPCIRLTNVGIRGVPLEMKEAAYAFGSSPWQVLIKVELPQALPTIMAGINQTTMAAMAMVVISSMIGAKGLGENVLIAINRTDIGLGFDAGISIVFLAIIIDRLTQKVSHRQQID